MSLDDPLNPGPGVLSVATNGIQDVSPFLPLIGTEHCERLVTSALKQGLLYAAATPMTIFGSLGILKAGFITLWSSIDTPIFSGPTLLKDAGFLPSGHGTLLLHVADTQKSLYVAEDKLRYILAKKRVRSVTTNVLSKDLVGWNFRLIFCTAVLSSLGLLPYIYPIHVGLPGEKFPTTWIYPFIRILGCGIIAVTIQLLYQLRILEETYCRIKFIAMDSYLKDHGKSVPHFWDPNERSRQILLTLRSVLMRQAPPPHPTQESIRDEGGATATAASDTPPPRDPEQDVNVWRATLGEEIEKCLLDALGRMTSFELPTFASLQAPSTPPPTPGPSTSGACSNPEELAVPVLSCTQAASPADPNAAEKGEAKRSLPTYPPAANTTSMHAPLRPLPPFLAWVTRTFTTLLLWLTQLFLLLGIGLTIVGYIGCFSIIQAQTSWRGPVVWLALEAFLGTVRTALWAYNPTWDDAKCPIALEKVPCDDEPAGKVKENEKKSSYGIGWMLDSVTADDMHALIIAVNEVNSKELIALTECENDGERVAKYLEETLLVPRGQITKLYGEEATKERIKEELKAMAHRGSVAQDAPIVIYFAGHSFISQADKTTYLVPYRSRDKEDVQLEKTSLAYRDVVDLLGHIGQEKTDTITLILDCCHAGAMGKNDKFDKDDNKLKAPAVAARTPSTIRKNSLATLQADDALARTVLQDGKRATRKIRKTEREILIGHASHILLAGTRMDQYAMEDPDKGGRFTRYLLEVLNKPDTLSTRTYKQLVDEVNKLTHAKHKYQQDAICTTIYQERLLFNGLFSRKLNDKSRKPVITVQYSDH